jgi:UDP-N-acetyl-2-amino-2-deoxyglucuronate dehydrogenase
MTENVQIYPSSATFVVFGVSGFVARKHLNAIQAVGGVVAAACDRHDSAGVLDSVAPGARFFLDEAETARFLATAPRSNRNFCVICTPTDLHLSHAQLALANGWSVICEKPVVRNLHEYQSLVTAESAAAGSAAIWPVLQMRLHPALRTLREAVRSGPANTSYDVDLKYVTPRGEWYRRSWKGNPGRSGGLAFNIGIHLFDILQWIFGDANSIQIERACDDHVAGLLDLERARVSWLLSTRLEDHPQFRDGAPLQPYRRMTLNDAEIDFSVTRDLHTEVYRSILCGTGIRLADVLASLRLACEVQQQTMAMAMGAA